MNKTILITITFLIFTATSSIGQNNNVAQPELESGTIEEQFDYIITKSTKFKEFQLIRKTSILKVKAHALDSLKTARKNLAAANTSSNEYQTTIRSLETEVKTLKEDIETISVNVDSISFLGSSLSKSAYNSIVWTLIVCLSLFLVIIIARLKSNVSITKTSKSDLEKIEIELDKFKKNALKKEQEIMRKLQDEINKNNP